jgi:hypothetical protein
MPLKDDPKIKDDAALWRRIPPVWFVWDDNARGMRVSSAAFSDSEDGSPLSVLLADVVAATKRTAHDVLGGFEGYGLASITAGTARKNGQGVMPTPIPDTPDEKGEPAHASVFGKKTQGSRRGMAKAAKWVIPPPAGSGRG